MLSAGALRDNKEDSTARVEQYRNAIQIIVNQYNSIGDSAVYSMTDNTISNLLPWISLIGDNMLTNDEEIGGGGGRRSSTTCEIQITRNLLQISANICINKLGWEEEEDNSNDIIPLSYTSLCSIKTTLLQI